MLNRLTGSEYRWYISGCAETGELPLPAQQFWPQYRRYQRYDRFVKRYRQWQSGARLRRASREAVLYVIKGEMDRLHSVNAAVRIGEWIENQEEVGSCGSADLYMPPAMPPLIGAGAMLEAPIKAMPT